MSSKFIVVVDILGCNVIVTDLIITLIHLHHCFGKSMFLFSTSFPGVLFSSCGQKRIDATFFYVHSTLCVSILFIALTSLN